jgi:Carboxypeptidase regulatory-like domain/TonB dependent receptor/TonB-dependent Receptor Plug Domain
MTKRFGSGLLCMLALGISGIAWGQGLTGSIVGTVTDPSSAVVPRARITVRNASTNAEVQTMTDADGVFRAVGLVPGNYTVTAEGSGFRQATTSPQTVDVSTPLRLDLKLEIGAVTETVSVETHPTRVNTEDAQLGQVLRNISQLPLLSGNAGRNPLALVGVQPGVTLAGVSPAPVVSTNALGPFSVNGQRTQANNYILDGGDSNDLAINVPDSVQQISPDALEEFRVVTGAAKAEYGRNAGATVELVTKSGGNRLHGGLQETFRNKVLNAVPFFQKVTPGPVETFTTGLPRKPDWKSNDYDANLGGPIRKDKTFFFVSYLGFRRVQGVARSATVFTDQERAAINQFGVPAAKALLALVPAASTVNTLFVSPANSLHRDQGIAKVDHHFSSRNTFSGMYFIEDQTATDPFPFGGTAGIPGFGTVGITNFKNLALRDTHIFSADLLNEARVSVHRRESDSVRPLNKTSLSSLGFSGVLADDPVAQGPPSIRINGLTEFGNTIQGPQARFDTTWQYADTLSWIRGKHGWKFGVDYKAYEQNQLFEFINNGVYTFDGLGTQSAQVTRIPGITNDAVNDFARGFVTDFEQSNANRQGYRDKFFSAYAQDDWKVRHNLTLNIGVRWEYDAPLTEIRDQLSTFHPGQQSTVFPDAPVGLVYPGDKGVTRSTYNRDLNNFAPRFGFAWDPRGDGRWSVRGGYGIFFDAPVSELTLQFLGVLPYGIQTDETTITDFTRPYATSQDNPIPQPFPFHPVAKGGHFDFSAVAPIGLTIMDPSFATPYSQMYNLQLQRQLGSDWVFEVGYVGSKGTKLLNRTQQNYAIVTPTATTGNTNSRRRYNLGNPQDAAYGGAVFGGITDQLTNANSNYNSLQTSLTKRLSRGLMTTHAYTWSHAIDEGSGLRTGAAAGQGNIYNRALDYGNAEFDVRHRYVGTVVYELPFLKSRKDLLGYILGGWGTSLIVAAQTGVPINIVESADRCLCDMPTSAQHPNFLGGDIRFYDPRNVTAVAGRPNSYFNGTGGGSATGAGNPYFLRVGTGNSAALGAGRLGTFGRNVFPGPGYANWDIDAVKRFTIRENHAFEFHTQFVNAFNHTQFDAIGSSGLASIGSPNFGKISSTLPPRIIQLSARYTF